MLTKWIFGLACLAPLRPASRIHFRTVSLLTVM